MKINNIDAKFCNKYEYTNQTAQSNSYASWQTISHKSRLSNHGLQININSEKLLNFSDFERQLKKSFPNKSMFEVIECAFQNPFSRIGVGGHNFVIKIPDIDDYVIKIPNILTEIPKDLTFTKLIDVFPKQNFGQAVAKSNEGIQILKRVNGQNHDVPASKIMSQNGAILKEDAEYFLNNIKRISEFNQDSFTNFARKLKEVNKNNRYLVDSNSYNLLVDFEKQEFNIVDLYDRLAWPGLEECSNDAETMINMILSYINHKLVYDRLNEPQKHELIEYSRTVIKKCLHAANLVNLKPSSVSQEEILDIVTGYLKMQKYPYADFPVKSYYKSMCSLYNDLIPIKTTMKEDKSHKKYINDLISLFNEADSIEKYYLAYLYELDKINSDDVIKLADLYLAKWSKEDYDYFITKKIPLTVTDDSGIIENRLKCLRYRQINEKDIEYLENKDRIINEQCSLMSRFPKEKKMVIITGLPGVGKTTLANELYGEQYYIADVDTIKEAFPSYHKNAKSLNTLHSVGRIILQEKLIPNAIKQGTNIVVPTTGLSDYITWLCEGAKNYGYRVELIHIQADKERAMQSVKDRFYKNGKFVDPLFIVRRAPLVDSQINELKNLGILDNITIMPSFLNS